MKFGFDWLNDNGFHDPFSLDKIFFLEGANPPDKNCFFKLSF